MLKTFTVFFPKIPKNKKTASNNEAVTCKKVLKIKFKLSC